MYQKVRPRGGNPGVPVPGPCCLSASVGNVDGQSGYRSPKRLVRTRKIRSRMSVHSSLDCICASIDSLPDQDVSFGSG